MDERIVGNGINPDTGEHVAAVSLEELGAVLREAPHDERRERYLEMRSDRSPTYGLPFDVDPLDVASAGWCAVFSTDEPEGVRRALAPLLERRQSQVRADRFKVLDHRPGEDFLSWLARNGAHPGSPEPTRVPYYVLLVGPPTRIAFELQYLLDGEYSVGRLCFDDADDYRRYAESVVAHEEAPPTAPPHVAFFATNHLGDRATNMSASLLVEPLARGYDGRPGIAERYGATAASWIGDAARREALLEVLAEGGGGRPSVLFTATHGLGGLPPGDPRQRAEHGALLCQDWPGGPVEVGRQTVTAADVQGAHVHGMVAFFFACYGAGTPEVDEFPRVAGGTRPRIADEPFVAALPRALLAHPNGSALAAIGHVERAWGYSIAGRAGVGLQPFENALGQIVVGRPVGAALGDFNDKYAALSTNLASLLREMDYGLSVPPSRLAALWTERNDAQNFVLLGDPAVRLASGRPPV
ncbi:MAG: C25 family cysteine peptidase [Acidimicrobiales bacterium]